MHIVDSARGFHRRLSNNTGLASFMEDGGCGSVVASARKYYLGQTPRVLFVTIIENTNYNIRCSKFKLIRKFILLIFF